MFAQAYMFVYSPRRGTPAAVWHEKDPVPKDVAQDRFMRLCAVEDAAVRAYHDRKIGTTVRALIHGVSRKDPTRLARQDDRQRHREFPDDRSRARPGRPWVDVRVDRPRCGACAARAWAAPHARTARRNRSRRR